MDADKTRSRPSSPQTVEAQAAQVQLESQPQAAQVDLHRESGKVVASLQQHLHEQEQAEDLKTKIEAARRAANDRGETRLANDQWIESDAG